MEKLSFYRNKKSPHWPSSTTKISQCEQNGKRQNLAHTNNITELLKKKIWYRRILGPLAKAFPVPQVLAKVQDWPVLHFAMLQEWQFHYSSSRKMGRMKKIAIRRLKTRVGAFTKVYHQKTSLREKKYIKILQATKKIFKKELASIP